MADISKIKLANGTTVTLKDAQGRADMTTLLNKHALEGLGAAAWKAVATEVSQSADLPTAEAVKSYVDSAVGKVHNFDVVIDADGSASTGPSVEASADTMYKIYLVPSDEAAAGSYIEYITIKSGDGETVSFKWEAIRSTKTNLTGYVPTSTTIAEIKLDHNITVAELQKALGLGAMAYADTASGSTTVSTVDSITMAPMTIAGNATVTLSDADADLTKGNFTPAGTIKIGENASDADHKVLTGGSINVTLKESAEAKKATISSSTTYSPVGTVTAKEENGSFSAIKSVALEANVEGDIQIKGSVAEQTVSLTSTPKTFVTGLVDGAKKAATLKNGTFTPAAIQEGFYTAGSDASLKGGNYTAPTLGEASKGNVASEGIVASVGAKGSADEETLIFTAAASAEVVTAQGTLTEGSVSFPTLEGGKATVIDTTKFSGGSKDDDTLTAEFIPTVETSTVNDVTAAKLAGFNFASDKYSLNTTSDTALKDVEFKATNSATIPSEITYKQSEIDAATFSGTSDILTFAGTEQEKILVTGVSYKKAGDEAAFSVTQTPAVAENGIKKTDKTVNITVNPDVKD